MICRIKGATKTKTGRMRESYEDGGLRPLVALGEER